MASVELVTAPIGAAVLATGPGELASTPGEFESALNEAQFADGGQRLDGRPQSSGDAQGTGSEPDVSTLAKGDVNLTARLVAIRTGQQWAGRVVTSLFLPDARLSAKGAADVGVDAPDAALETHEQSGVQNRPGETVVAPPILTPIVEWTSPAPGPSVGLLVGTPGDGLLLDESGTGESRYEAGVPSISLHSTLLGDDPMTAQAAMRSVVEGPEPIRRDASLAEPATHFNVSAVGFGLESVRTEETLSPRPGSSAELEAMSATLAGPGALERAIETDRPTPQTGRSVVSEREPQRPEPRVEHAGRFAHAVVSAVEPTGGRQATDRASADELHPTKLMSARSRQTFAGGRSMPYSSAALAPPVAEPSGSDASEFEMRFSADRTRATTSASPNASDVTTSKRARGSHEEPTGDPRASAESASRASARLTAALFDVSERADVRAVWTEGDHATARPPAPVAPSVRDTASPLPPAPLLAGSVNQAATPSEPARTAVLTVAGDGAGIPDRSVELHGQIVQALRMQWTSRGGDVRIQLQPDYLGELAVSLSVNQGRVVAQLTASSPDVRQWIETNEAALRQSLAHHDLTLERMIVKEENTSAFGHPDQEAPEPDRQRQRPRPRRPAPDATFEVVV